MRSWEVKFSLEMMLVMNFPMFHSYAKQNKKEEKT